MGIEKEENQGILENVPEIYIMKTFLWFVKNNERKLTFFSFSICNPFVWLLLFLTPALWLSEQMSSKSGDVITIDFHSTYLHSRYPDAILLKILLKRRRVSRKNLSPNFGAMRWRTPCAFLSSFFSFYLFLLWSLF